MWGKKVGWEEKERWLGQRSFRSELEFLDFEHKHAAVVD
jgi:hypothetical protein